MQLRIFASVLAFALAASAQNIVPNGEFHGGATGWTLIAFNDPAGATGFGSARTAGHGPSHAVFADFQTLGGVRSASWRTAPVALPAVTLPVGFRVLWEKQVTTPIPFPSVNRVELRIIDTVANAIVYTGTLQVPNQTGLTESASFSAVATLPAASNYAFEVFMRHSNLAQLPFTTWVDDVYCGSLNVDYFGQACAGTGGFVPAIGTSGEPVVNSNNFTIEVSDTVGPTAAVFMIDLSNTTWAGGSLPFAMGNGCDLLTGGSVALFHVITTSGAGNGMASQIVPLPNNPGLQGLVLYSQWGVFDASAGNIYGAAMSAGLSIIIQ